MKDNKIPKVIQPLDNVKIGGQNILLMDNVTFNNYISDNVDETEERDLDYELAIDFIMFCMTKENQYKAKKLNEFGIAFQYIAEKLGIYDKSGARKCAVSYENKKTKVKELMNKYIKVQNELADIKADYIREGMKDKTEEELIKDYGKLLNGDGNND